MPTYLRHPAYGRGRHKTVEKTATESDQLAFNAFMNLARGLVVRTTPNGVHLFADKNTDPDGVLCTIPTSRGANNETINFEGVLVDRHLAFATLSHHWVWDKHVPWIISPQNGGILTVENVAIPEEVLKKSVWPIGWPVVWDNHYYTLSAFGRDHSKLDFNTYLSAYIQHERLRTRKSKQKILAECTV